MNIARLGSDVTLLVDEGMLSTELITQAVDLAIELGSCHTLTVIGSAGDAKSDVFGSRWKKVSKTKLRMSIRRAPAALKHDEPEYRRPARVAARSARPVQLTQKARKKKKIGPRKLKKTRRVIR
jgi:hypothetical protein